MAARNKANPYEGKIKLYIGDRPAEELGEAYVSAVVTDWFIRSMFRSCRGKPGFEGLAQWEYLGIDCEKYKKEGCVKDGTACAQKTRSV